MDEQEYRAKLIERDKASLDKRVKRWQQLMPVTYNVALPDLAWSYLTEADDMFIRGHFMGVILLCAGIMELVLAAQLKSRTRMTQDEVERFGLEQMVILSHRLGMLDDKEAQRVDELRKLRNALIHANTDRLNQMARRRYKECGLDAYDLGAGLFLTTAWGVGIDQDALTCLQLTRDLTVKFYGAQDAPDQ